MDTAKQAVQQTQPPKTSGITLKDKAGYALGDVGCVLFYSMLSQFLQMFYTDVLKISLGNIAVLFLVMRIWDGINDPILGTIVDRRSVGKNGKFRPYLRGAAIPFGVFGILLFTKIPGLSAAGYLAYAYLTHLLYEGTFTVLNIPYGSMASVITDDGNERAQLSMWRSIGSGIGGLPAAVLLPMFVYSASTAQTGEVVKYLDPNKLFVCTCVFAVLSVIILWTSFKMTTERLLPPPAEKEERHSIFFTVATLLKNRPFVTLCIVSALMIGLNSYTTSVYNYLYKDYFGRPELTGLLAVATYAPTVLLIPFLNKLVVRFGKKNLCACGVLLSSLSSALAFIMRTGNPFVFLIFCFLSGLGLTFLTMEIWALVMDVLDYQELLSRKREEGTCYSIFFFTRKLGTTAAGSGSTLILRKIGYDVNSAQTGQAPAVARSMYTIATAVPAIVFLLMFLTLAFLYPLGKKEEEEMRAELRLRRNPV